MNKTQKITVAVMTVVAAVMIAGPIALNYADSAFAAPPHPHPHPHPCNHIGQKNCFPPCHIVHTHPPRVICTRHH